MVGSGMSQWAGQIVGHIFSRPIAGEGKNPFKIGERRINWIWYKPVPQKKLKEILLGKSGQQFEDGIPPNEIREEIVNDLFKEAEEKLPPQLVELVKITKQPQTGNLTTGRLRLMAFVL